jgi:hypothetical protein
MGLALSFGEAGQIGETGEVGQVGEVGQFGERADHSRGTGAFQVEGRGGSGRDADGDHAGGVGGTHVPGRIPDIPARARILAELARRVEQQVRSRLGMLDVTPVDDRRLGIQA